MGERGEVGVVGEEGSTDSQISARRSEARRMVAPTKCGSRLKRSDSTSGSSGTCENRTREGYVGAIAQVLTRVCGGSGHLDIPMLRGGVREHQRSGPRCDECMRCGGRR